LSGVRTLAARAYFAPCALMGRLLRAARYSRAEVIEQAGVRRVRKRRAWYAPLLVWLSGPLVRLLDTGVRVLPQRLWEERERDLYRRLYTAEVQVEHDGTLTLPGLAGQPLAAILEGTALDQAGRTEAIALAVTALAELHRAGVTHGDAMADNVLVDLDGGVARWFDFETVHDANRSPAWRRADDLRALLSTCLVRTPPGAFADVLGRIVETYGDEAVARLVAARFSTVWQRPLAFGLAQAGLSYLAFQEIGRLLRIRPRTARER
jgi:tRNA A-37 threonylcarbamoyl transferase component Bud32